MPKPSLEPAAKVPATVATEPAGLTLRRRLLLPSATKSTPLLGSWHSPSGLLNPAAAPTASAQEAPLPASADTTPVAIVYTRTRCRVRSEKNSLRSSLESTRPEGVERDGGESANAEAPAPAMELTTQAAEGGVGETLAPGLGVGVGEAVSEDVDVLLAPVLGEVLGEDPAHTRRRTSQKAVLMYVTPRAASTATPRGLSTLVSAASVALPGLGELPPLPATVLVTPAGLTLRSLLPPPSATSTLTPCASQDMCCGVKKEAEVPLPSLESAMALPASVPVVPAAVMLRMRLLDPDSLTRMSAPLGVTTIPPGVVKVAPPPVPSE